MRISVIIPTYNRPDELRRAVQSVLAQTYEDFEIIVCDDGVEKRADQVVNSFKDSRIRYIRHERSQGGSAARNTAIKASQADFVAFLDDDDQWEPEKLAVQLVALQNAPPDVGFSFTGVRMIKEDTEAMPAVPEGIGSYYELALRSFNTMLMVTLMVRREVFDAVGLMDEGLPSHQDAELLIRIAQKYKGLGINKPLTRVTFLSTRDHVGGDPRKRIAGRERLLMLHQEEYAERKSVLAKHLFWLGIMYRDIGEFGNAKKSFGQALAARVTFRYLLHYVSMAFDGILLRIFRTLTNRNRGVNT